MERKAKARTWFGCKPCLYTPRRNEKQSSENWSVYSPGKCPKCGAKMRMHFETPPEEITAKWFERALLKED
jgi:hypothetical protein